MCTCGIDIATQHDTPATHSRACSVPGERPSGRSPWAAAGWWMPLTAGSGPGCAGGRRRSTSASGNITSRQNTPMPM
ncbi:hypothetical protein D9M69_528570 [compost metagenome]